MTVSMCSRITARNISTMIKMIVTTLIVTVVSATSYASPSEKYPVSPLAWELHVDRVGDVIFRYVRFLSESDYPCLRLETFETIRAPHPPAAAAAVRAGAAGTGAPRRRRTVHAD